MKIMLILDCQLFSALVSLFNLTKSFMLYLFSKKLNKRRYTEITSFLAAGSEIYTADGVSK
jgi:hypothetical protein